MKKTISLHLLFILFLTSFQVHSQGLFSPGSARGAGWLTGQLPENASFNLTVGTNFSSFSSGTNMLSNYISPQLQYDLSPSLSIIAGGSFSINQYGNLPQSVVVHDNVAPVQQGLNDHSLFMSGRYMINDKLFMTGTVYSEQGHMPVNLMNQGIMNFSNQGMSMGIEYRMNDNLHFGAELGVNRSDNPYQHLSPFSDPFGNRHRGSRYRAFP